MDIVHNEAKNQFEYTENGETAYIKYSIYRKKNLALTHTSVPESMQGKGVASVLTEYAFDYAKKNNKMVMVYCSAISNYLKKNTNLRVQLNPEYHPTSTMNKKIALLLMLAIFEIRNNLRLMLMRRNTFVKIFKMATLNYRFLFFKIYFSASFTA